MLTTPNAIAKKLLEVLSKIPPDLQDTCGDIATEFFKDFQHETIEACARVPEKLAKIPENKKPIFRIPVEKQIYHDCAAEIRKLKGEK